MNSVFKHKEDVSKEHVCSVHLGKRYPSYISHSSNIRNNLKCKIGR